MWKTYALLGAVFAALTSILAKIGITGVDSNLATAIRTMVALVLAWIVVLITGSYTGLATISRHNVIFLCLSGLATGMSWLFFYRAIQLSDVSKVIPVDKLSIVLTIILAFLILKEVPTVQTVLGASFITIGVLIMLF